MSELILTIELFRDTVLVYDGLSLETSQRKYWFNGENQTSIYVLIYTFKVSRSDVVTFQNLLTLLGEEYTDEKIQRACFNINERFQEKFGVKLYQQITSSSYKKNKKLSIKIIDRIGKNFHFYNYL